MLRKHENEFSFRKSPKILPEKPMNLSENSSENEFSHGNSFSSERKIHLKA